MISSKNFAVPLYTSFVYAINRVGYDQDVTFTNGYLLHYMIVYRLLGLRKACSFLMLWSCKSWRQKNLLLFCSSCYDLNPYKSIIQSRVFTKSSYFYKNHKNIFTRNFSKNTNQIQNDFNVFERNRKQFSWFFKKKYTTSLTHKYLFIRLSSY